MGFVIRAVANALALWVATLIIGGIHVDGGWFTYFKIAVVFGLVNGTIGMIVRFFTFPLAILTLGFFMLIVNAAMLAITDNIMGSFTVDNFGSALLGAIIISIVGAPASVAIKRALNA